MKKLLLITIIIVGVYVAYTHLQAEPEVRIKKALTIRWFKMHNHEHTAFMDAVKSFEVDKNFNVTVNLSSIYNTLGSNNQLNLQRGLVSLIRSETLKKRGTITFVFQDEKVATVAKDNDNVISEQQVVYFQ